MVQMQQLQTRNNSNRRHGIRLVGHGAYNNDTIINSGLIARRTHENRNSIYVSDDNNVLRVYINNKRRRTNYDGKFYLVIKMDNR